MAQGFAATTKMSVLGRGKQKGLKVGDTYYDEIPKEMLMIVIEDKEEDKVVRLIAGAAKTDKNGTYGDGKIFVSQVERAVTISEIRFLAAIGTCLRIAADVLLVGIPATSPRETIFGYVLCTSVSLSTITQASAASLPSVQPSPASLTKSGADIGGVKCRKS